MTPEQTELLMWMFPPTEHPQWWTCPCDRCLEWNRTDKIQWTGPNPWHHDQDTADIAAFRVLRPWLLEHGQAISDKSVSVLVYPDKGFGVQESTYSAALIAACKRLKEQADEQR